MKHFKSKGAIKFHDFLSNQVSSVMSTYEWKMQNCVVISYISYSHFVSECKCIQFSIFFLALTHLCRHIRDIKATIPSLFNQFLCFKGMHRSNYCKYSRMFVFLVLFIFIRKALSPNWVFLHSRQMERGFHWLQNKLGLQVGLPRMRQWRKLWGNEVLPQAVFHCLYLAVFPATRADFTGSWS